MFDDFSKLSIAQFIQLESPTISYRLKYRSPRSPWNCPSAWHEVGSFVMDISVIPSVYSSMAFFSNPIASFIARILDSRSVVASASPARMSARIPWFIPRLYFIAASYCSRAFTALVKQSTALSSSARLRSLSISVFASSFKEPPSRPSASIMYQV